MLFNRKQLDQFKTTRRARDLKRSLGGLNGAVEIRTEREGEKLRILKGTKQEEKNEEEKDSEREKRRVKRRKGKGDQEDKQDQHLFFFF